MGEGVVFPFGKNSFVFSGESMVQRFNHQEYSDSG
jgi:hypothetical protein